MKTSPALCFLILASGFPAIATNDLPAVTLTGLVRLPNEEKVLLEARGNFPGIRHHILMAGDKESGVEVLRIDAEKGSVDLVIPLAGGAQTPSSVTGARFSPDGKSFVTMVTGHFPDETNRLESGQSGLIFKNAEFREVLSFYSRYANRTLLRPAALPGFKVTLKAAARDRQEAAAILEKALLEKGISSLPDGDKFLILVRTSDAGKFKPHSSEIKIGAQNKAELIPAGMVNFLGVEAFSVAQIYAELVGRKFDRSRNSPAAPTITFWTQNPMSKEELVYALDTQFALEGLKMELVGDDSIRLVYISDEKR